MNTIANVINVGFNKTNYDAKIDDRVEVSGDMMILGDNIVGRGAKNKLVKCSASLKSDDQRHLCDVIETDGGRTKVNKTLYDTLGSVNASECVPTDDPNIASKPMFAKNPLELGCIDAQECEPKFNLGTPKSPWSDRKKSVKSKIAST